MARVVSRSAGRGVRVVRTGTARLRAYARTDTPGVVMVECPRCCVWHKGTVGDEIPLPGYQCTVRCRCFPVIAGSRWEMRSLPVRVEVELYRPEWGIKDLGVYRSSELFSAEWVRDDVQEL